MNFFEAQLRTTLWKACISEKTENNQQQVVQTSNLVNTETATKSHEHAFCAREVLKRKSIKEEE
jgi:hypothetical protein